MLAVADMSFAGHVHAMISSSWLPNALNVTWESSDVEVHRRDKWGSAWNSSVSVSAAVSENKHEVVVRLLSNLTTPVEFHIDISEMASSLAPVLCHASVLVAPTLWGPLAVNDPATPRRVEPKLLSGMTCSATTAAVTLPAHSFAVLEIQRKSSPV